MDRKFIRSAFRTQRQQELVLALVREQQDFATMLNEDLKAATT